MTAAANATPSRAETKAWNAALARLQDAGGPTGWSLVETDFATFMAKYPASEHYPEAVVYCAQAMFEQKKFDQTIILLSSESTNAGVHADKFLYWTALAYSRKGADEKAADTFAQLARQNPDSSLRPEALYREAEAHSRLGAWKRVVEDLGEADGPFQKFAQANPNVEMAVRGMLLLAQARLVQKDYSGMENILSSADAGHWAGDFAWQRQYLLCRGQLEQGQTSNALAGATNLILLAGIKPDLKARSTLLLGDLLENAGRMNEAAKAYQSNLDPALPAERRQEALLRSVELMLRQGRVPEARALLENFPATNSTLLLLRGELALKQYLTDKPGGASKPAPAATNTLQTAGEDFQQLISNFGNSPHLGKAWLNLGWCQLESGKIPEARDDFRMAAGILPPSEDRAVAYFKLGDIACRQGAFAEALTNYENVLRETNSILQPEVRRELAGQALYQIIRSGLGAGNSAVADAAMKQLLDEFPGGQLAEHGLLYLGQSKGPAESRAEFAEFTNRFPQSELVPRVRFATGRSYELEGDWTNALATYKNWLKDYPSNELHFQAEFLVALMTSKAGDETNAFQLFTNYVAVYQSNAMARAQDFPARAQFWVGDYYWRQEDYQKAELSYEDVFTKWTNSPLAFQALLKCGGSALHRQSPQEAKGYLTNLTSNPNCPPAIKAQAVFALGDANSALPNASNPRNFDEAIEDFHYIVETYTNSAIVPRAWGRMGDCYVQIAALSSATSTNAAEAAELAKITLTNYTRAGEAYLKAMESTSVSDKSEAELRLGDVDEKMSRLVSDAERKNALLRSAFGHYLNVFDGSASEQDQPADQRSVRDAGLKAAELARSMGDAPQAMHIYQRMIKTLPSLKAELEKKIAEVQQPPTSAGQ